MKDSTDSLLTSMCWLNKPLGHSFEPDGTLHATASEGGDFWRTTHYGFVRDSGHFMYTKATGEFTAALSFQAAYHNLYDQAGLMIRLNEQQWVKFGIELTDGMTHLSVVATNRVSDWSAVPWQIAIDENTPVIIRATRIGDALLLQVLDSGTWHMVRLVPFAIEPDAVSVGPYLCAPQGSGFNATFSSFSLVDPVVRELHT